MSKNIDFPELGSELLSLKEPHVVRGLMLWRCSPQKLGKSTGQCEAVGLRRTRGCCFLGEKYMFLSHTQKVIKGNNSLITTYPVSSGSKIFHGVTFLGPLSCSLSTKMFSSFLRNFLDCIKNFAFLK